MDGSIVVALGGFPRGWTQVDLETNSRTDLPCEAMRAGKK